MTTGPLNTPHSQVLWDKLMEGFKYISGDGWENRAGYEHFWPLVRHLYKLAHGEDTELPDTYMGALILMLGGHVGRTRKGIRKRPYFHHILMVTYLSWLFNLPLHHQLAAISHDDVEDVPKQLNVVADWIHQQLAYQHPHQVLSIVKNLTNVPHPGGKHAGQLQKMETMPHLDAVLKLLDRICNLYDMRQDKPKGFTPERIEQECRNALELAAAMPIPAPPEVLYALDRMVALLRKENGLQAA